MESQCALVLQHLYENAGQVVTQSELLEAVWGRNAVSVQSVPVVISKLRALLGDDMRNPRYIETISKRGYRLIAAVEDPISDPPVTTPFLGWTGTSKPILITVAALLLVLGLVFMSGRLQPSQRAQKFLYIADVENLTNNVTMNAVASGAGVILSSELARASGLSIVRLRGGGDSLKEEAARRIGFGETMPPILRTSVVQTEKGSGVVMLLEDGADRSLVWTHAFEVTETTYAAGQREAAHRLLDYLNVEENRQAVTYSSNVPRVEENYLRAKYMWSLRGRDNNALAANLALRVLQLDADYLPAHALLAEIFTKYDGEYLNLGPVDTETMARGHLRAAESIDPNHLSVLVARARQLLLLDRRPDLALAVLEKAVELAPEESMPYRLRASSLNILGRMDESLRDLEAALDLEFGSPYVEVEFILNHYLGAQHKEVVRLSESLAPEFLGRFKRSVAASYFALGQYKESMQVWLDVVDDVGIDIEVRKDLLRLAENRQVQEAFKMLNDYVGAATSAEEYRLDQIYWSLYSGEDERALDLLTSTPINRDYSFLVTLHRRPLFNRFHDHPAMQDFLRRIGVAQYANCVHQACGNPSAS